MSKVRDFPGIGKESVDRFRAVLARQGIDVPAGDSGVIEYRGVKLSFAYQPGTETLRLSLDEKPFIISEGYVWDLVEKAINPEANV